MELLANERLDYVNDKLSLIQKTDGLTFGTDALLLAGFISGKYKSGIEIGGGSGIISMLLLTRNKLDSCHSVEVQEDYARLTERNAELNGLTDRLKSIHIDIRNYNHGSECDIVFSNPPYMKSTSGLLNNAPQKTAARHEINGDIGELIAAGVKALRYGGSFYIVYHPDRMCDLIQAMRNSGVEPKRICFVHARASSEPSMLLIEGKRGGKCGITVTRPLIIYESDTNEYTPDMKFIMENGDFPKDFKR